MSSREKKAPGKFTPEYRPQAVNRVLAGQAMVAVARELGQLAAQRGDPPPPDGRQRGASHNDFTLAPIEPRRFHD